MANALLAGSALLGSKSALTGQSLKQRSPVCRSQVRPSTVAAASSRPSWCPGWPIPKHLDGKLAGDFGFDPLNLGAEPEALRWYTQAELIHSRWAMTAVAGILIPDVSPFPKKINAHCHVHRVHSGQM
ncbi:hypothetical protein WJX84_003454 [Apatococcus fuscideae]|uniref:Chlorophyll a-b binding protein, chloroplastic n=1 Tax=Apatococcus fuscideae TaxID=2026836 RepID=A0AAW1T2I1_9CHLO